ncbi:glycoside hydrolase family 71 protein [Roridomyces roridus]|uniref:Glycoside hydrolase family 71 protein n=1 Tax=Roridomyces roridus TaxID=1738132 RepID=A0AAD7CG06_9AGAR|nr:glycoside hydrolase family 71 protein [Roridomyces roridus]
MLTDSSFMVGNTYPYTIADWEADIEEASTHEIDGFALNVGKEDWQRDRVATCFEAASRSHRPFSLSLSFDMSSIPASTSTDIDLLCEYLQSFGTHPRMFRYHGKVLVSTFAGESATFGRGSFEQGWKIAKETMEQIVPVHFVPAFFIDPARYPEISSIDGVFNWNGGWPIHLTPAHPRSEIECRTFMAAVSPWFFTFIYRSDDWLLVRRWEQLIALRDRVDIVQVISWNDYGESHYICPTVRGAQPAGSEAAWLRLNAFFARVFKTLVDTVEKDEVYLWGRPHPRDASGGGDVVPKPANWELTEDVFWVVVLCVAPATVSLSCGGNSKEKTYTVGTGLSKLSHPLQVGAEMKGVVRRQGVVVAECNAEGFTFVERPEGYNFNAFTAMSS